jgi:hypothetical protein
MVQRKIHDKPSVNKTEFESLLIESNSRDKLDSDEWTKAIIDDVSIYNAYFYVRESNYGMSTTYGYNVISEIDDSKKLFSYIRTTKKQTKYFLDGFLKIRWVQVMENFGVTVLHGPMIQITLLS